MLSLGVAHELSSLNNGYIYTKCYMNIYILYYKELHDMLEASITLIQLYMSWLHANIVNYCSSQWCSVHSTADRYTYYRH